MPLEVKSYRVSNEVDAALRRLAETCGGTNEVLGTLLQIARERREGQAQTSGSHCDCGQCRSHTRANATKVVALAALTFLDSNDQDRPAALLSLQYAAGLYKTVHQLSFPSLPTMEAEQ